MFPTFLRRDIVLLIAVKLALLTLLYLLFFAPAHRIAATPALVQRHLLDPP